MSLNGIIIFNPRIARDLIRRKYPLKDIAEHNTRKGQTIFVFEPSQDIIDYLEIEHDLIIKQ